MLLSLGSVLLSMVMASQAIPPLVNKALGTAKGDAIGSAFFMTNHPAGNYIIGSDIGPDGQLTLRTATDAGGFGVHGIHDTGPDGTYSANSIQIAQEKGILVTVNPASSTIVAFKISDDDCANLTMIGEPVPSLGDYAVSVAINQAEDKVCALNSGANNGVSCFTLDEETGLTLIPNTVRSLGLDQTTPPTGTAGTASSLIFSEDESKLYIAVKATDLAINVDEHPGYFVVYNISSSDDSLSELPTAIVPVPVGALQPFAMNPIPGQNAIFGADGAAGFYVWDLEGLDQGVQGPRASITPIHPMASICWSQYSNTTGHFFVVDGTIYIVSEISLDEDLKPTIVNSYPQGPTDGILDFQIALVNDKEFIYNIATNITAVKVYSIDGPGQLSNVQTLDFSSAMYTAGIAFDPNNGQGMGVYLK